MTFVLPLDYIYLGEVEFDLFIIPDKQYSIITLLLIQIAHQTLRLIYKAST